MRNLVIFGNSPYAERLYKYISLEHSDRVIAFTQEQEYISRSEIQELPVVAFESLHTYLNTDFEIILGIGYCKMSDLKEQVYRKCVDRGYMVGSYISDKAIVYTDRIGFGCFICPGALLGPDVTLGIGNYLGSGTILSHDNILGDFNFLSTNVVLGGSATIGNHCFVGLHATIKSDVHINDYTLVGAASNVLKITDVNKKGGVIVGNPAKLLEDCDSRKIKI